MFSVVRISQMLPNLIALIVIIPLIVLIKSIVWPRIIKFPWDENDNNNKDQKKQNQSSTNHQRIVILAGSYNPPHLGHLAMLEYLATRHKQVIAVVGFNPSKQYDVTPTQRKTILEEMIRTTNKTNIQVELVEGYIWRYAKKVGASLFFRGIRSWEKDGSDERQLQILNTWGPMLLGPLVWPIPTIYLEGNPKYNHVSSTLIRKLCTATTTTTTTTKRSQTSGKQDNVDGSSSSDENLDQLVPKSLVGIISDIYGKKDS